MITVQTFSSFSALELEAPWHGPLASHHVSHVAHGIDMPALSQAIIDLPSAQERPLFYISIYAMIGLATAFVTVLSVMLQYTGALFASRVLFKQLLERVVYATMRWHDTTPQGRFVLYRTKKAQLTDCTRSDAESLQQGSYLFTYLFVNSFKLL